MATLVAADDDATAYGNEMHVTPNVFEAGEGPRVVLLHSGAGDARDWRRMIGGLAAFRSAAVDFYGCGGTPAWPGPRAMTIDDQVELVRCVVHEPVHLCGHSYGGAVALRFAVKHPALVRSISVIEPQCYPLLRELGDPRFEVSLSLWNRVRALFELGEGEPAWRQFIDYFSGEGFWNRLRSEVRAAFSSVSPVERWAVLFSNPMMVRDLWTLEMPMLVLCGENTTEPERRMCEIVTDAAPGARLEMIGGAGHMSPMTHANDVATRIALHVSAAER